MAMLDRDMRYLAASRRYLSDYGVTHLFGRSHYEVFPETPKRWKRAHRRCLAGAIEICDEDQFMRPDGRVQWLRWEIQPWRDDDAGEINGILIFSEDITERKRLEAALHASEERLRRLLDTDAVGVLFFDYDGTLIGANDVFLRITGYTRAEVEARKLHWRDLTPPEWVKTSEEQMETFATTGRIGPYEKEYFLKDGSRRWMMFAGRDLGDGTIAEYCIDITERKALGDEGRRKDEFLAILGHELRNPLAAISTALQVLSGGGTPAQRGELEEVMVRQVALMRRLLDDLLDLGRITHGHIELVKERIDLAEFLRSAAESLQPAVVNRRQKLLLRLPPESVQFMADRVRLEQIATNLLSNASKYTDPEGRIELSGAREGSEVVLRCKDNGQGILPEYQEKIFEPFTRQTSQDGYGEASLGIGLALAKQLTELHEGTISVESGGAGKGSEFTVRLPLVAPPPVQHAAVQSKPAPVSRQARSVVIVEDNPSVATATRIVLEQAGHLVHVFADGASALEGVAGLKPDALLLDIGLPDMDGYALAAEMKKKRNMREALFVALSGFKQREHRGNPGDGFDHYFVKPVNAAEILALLAKHSRGVKTKAARGTGGDSRATVESVNLASSRRRSEKDVGNGPSDVRPPSRKTGR